MIKSIELSEGELIVFFLATVDTDMNVYNILSQCKIRVFFGYGTYDRINIICPNHDVKKKVKEKTGVIDRAFQIAYKNRGCVDGDCICTIEVEKENREKVEKVNHSTQLVVYPQKHIGFYCLECKNKVTVDLSPDQHKFICSYCKKEYRVLNKDEALPMLVECDV